MNSPLLLTYGLFILFGLLIYVAIIRWVFRIDKIANCQMATVWLLIKIAERQGVSEEEIETIKKSYYIK
jgi:hypothetical protein